MSATGRATKEQFIGHWVYWAGGSRIEQRLFANGKFRASVFAEDYRDTLIATAKGLWQVDGKNIQWRYTFAEGISVPRKLDINPILHIDDHHFALREPTRQRTDWYRAVKGSETSANFDLDELGPFLKCISRHITSGFRNAEISSLVKKVRRLRPDSDADFVFQIRFKGVICPFHIRVFMDDVNAPDVSLYGPPQLTRLVEKEMKR